MLYQSLQRYAGNGYVLCGKKITVVACRIMGSCFLLHVFRSVVLPACCKGCSHIVARSDLLCCLHKVCSHIMAWSDLFVLSARVECLSRGLVSQTCTHCGPVFYNRRGFLIYSKKGGADVSSVSPSSELTLETSAPPFYLMVV